MVSSYMVYGSQGEPMLGCSLCKVTNGTWKFCDYIRIVSKMSVY